MALLKNINVTGGGHRKRSYYQRTFKVTRKY